MYSEPVPELEKDDIYSIVCDCVRLSLSASGKQRIVVILYILDALTLPVLIHTSVPIRRSMPTPTAAVQAHVVLQKECIVVS